MIHIYMDISVWPSNVPNNGTNLYRNIIAYISKTDQVKEGSMDADAALIWSVLWNGKMSANHKVWQHYRKQNKPVIVIEVGGLVRNKTWRLSINGINRSAIFPAVEKLNFNRPKMFNLNILPWHTGDYILICGQHGKSEQWANMPSMGDYYKQTIATIRRFSERPIVIRNHPRYKENFKIDQVTWNTPNHIQQTYDSFDLSSVLANCHCSVSHSSNSGISSIIEGTPTIVSNESLAYDMSTTFESIENPIMLDREQWLVELCHKEWLENELEDAWRNLRQSVISSMPATLNRVI